MYNTEQIPIYLAKSNQFERGPPRFTPNNKNPEILIISGTVTKYFGNPRDCVHGKTSFSCDIRIAAETARSLSIYPNEVVWNKDGLILLGHSSINPTLRKEKYIAHFRNVRVEEDLDENAEQNAMPSFIAEPDWDERIAPDIRSTILFDVIKEKITFDKVQFNLSTYWMHVTITIIKKDDGIFLYLQSGKITNIYRAKNIKK